MTDPDEPATYSTDASAEDRGHKRPRQPGGEEQWREDTSDHATYDRPDRLVDALDAVGEATTGAEEQGPGVATEHSGRAEEVAPPGDAPPFLPDTNESVVEEAEHGSAAEQEIEAAVDARRPSNAERRAQQRRARTGGTGGSD